MFEKRTGFKPKPCMGLMGFLGFAGFLGFIFKEHFILVFFMFFGFFSFYWWSKIDYDIEDERLIKNQKRAVSVAYNFLGSCVLLGMLVVGWLEKDLALTILLLFCSFGVGMSFNIEAYLIYKYENEMD